MASNNNQISIQITAEDLASAVIQGVESTFKSAFDRIGQDAMAFAHIGQTVQFAFQTIAGVVGPVIDAAMKMDVINIQFKTVSGSSVLAAKDLDYVRGVADKLGLSFEETALSFGQFAGATKNTSLEGAKAKDIFEGLSMGITAMHLPAETAQRVLTQLAQAIGKNKMTMEDWRPILEAFPMLNERFATALGVSTAKLAQMMEAGQLTNTEIAKLGPILKDTFGADATEAAKSLQSEINRLKTAVFDANVSFGEFIKPALTEGIKTIADHIGLITVAAEALVGTGILVALGRVVSATTEVLVADAAAVTASREMAAAKIVEIETTLAAAEATYSEVSAKTAALVAERESLMMAEANTLAGIQSNSTSMRAIIVNEKLAATYIELAAANRIAVTANAEYELALEATTWRAAAANLAASALSKTMTLFGGPIGLAAATIAGLAYGLKSLIDYFVDGSEKTRDNTKAMAENAEAARKAAADRKAIADAYRAAVGEDLDQQLDQVQKTYEKENRAIFDEMEARRKEAKGNSAELQKIDEDEKKALGKSLDKFQAGSAAARAKDRKATESHYAEKLKLAEAYYKATGDSAMVDSLKYKQALANEIKDINAYYDQQEAEAQAAGIVLVGTTESRNKAILEAQKRHSRDAELVGLDQHAKELAHQKAADDAIIAEIKLKIDQHTVSEEEGNRQIILIQQKGTQALIDEQKKRVEILAKSVPNSDEYKNAVDALKKLETSFTSEVTTQAKSREKTQKNSLDNQLSATKNVYQADLNNLQEAENNKTISAEEATLRRLQLERDYAEKVASLRAQEVAQLNPETQIKEYADALATKLDADKAYLAAKKAVNDEEAKQLVEDTKKAVESADAWKEAANKNFEEFKSDQASFSKWWAGVWDEAYNNASTALKNLSDAAYNAFAEMHELPLKSVESLETLKQKANEAQQSYLDLYAAANHAALSVKADWSDGFKALNMIPAEAARITAEFYRQKVAAEELAIAIEKPTNETEQFAHQADEAAGNMKLLDSTTLDKLKTGIQKIKDAMISFTDSIKAALKSLQSDWDNLSMSKLELEEKRYNAQKLEWQDNYAKAQKQQNEDAIAALMQQLSLIEKIHAANVTDLKKDSSNSLSSIAKMAGGGNVGGSGTGDTQLRWLDPREWVINPGAVSYWGDDKVAAFNAPWSQAGQFLADRINGISLPPVSIPAPSFAMAGGGPAGVLPSGGDTNFTIYTTQPVDETFVRRHIIPVLDRREKQRK